MYKILIAIFLSVTLNTQTNNLSVEDSKKKIELDTKVELSRNYFVISAAVFIGGVALKNVDSDIEILGAGGSLAAAFTSSYFLVKHLIYVRKRNRFYKHHSLVRKSKINIKESFN
jgi:hypothetical protein